MKRTGTEAESKSVSASNRRLAKNSLMLYMRMFLSMLVGFYASRVVLNTLGVEDYGIYNVVGGVVSMLGFLSAAMSGATSRFLTFELGRGNRKELSETFSSALIIHVGLALVVCFISETLGLWFLDHKLVIPAERMPAAHWVLQTSILSAMLSVTQVPYNATVIAHEKMDIYAYGEILNVSFRLLIVYLLVIGDFDKLMLYGTLSCGVSAFMVMFYRIYCLRHYSESRFRWTWKPPLLKTMLSFSGWDLYGNASTVARTQGVNMLVNMFFGAAANAAAGVATTVQGVLMQFAGNISTAVRPQIVKSYSVGDCERSAALVYGASKYLYLLLLLLSAPILAETHFVLKTWLKVVPRYSMWMVRYMLVFNFFAQMSLVVSMGIHATGKIKRISLINGTLYMCVVPLAYVSYRLDGSIYTAYAFNALAVFIGCMSNVYTLGLSMREISVREFTKRVLAPVAFVSVCALFAAVVPRNFMREGFARFVTSGMLSTGCTALLAYAMAGKDVRQTIKRKMGLHA